MRRGRGASAKEPASVLPLVLGAHAQPLRDAAAFISLLLLLLSFVWFCVYVVFE
jgi:threonine/homoserine/homoserine lactone efflux protein